MWDSKSFVYVRSFLLVRNSNRKENLWSVLCRKMDKELLGRLLWKKKDIQMKLVLAVKIEATAIIAE